MTAGTNIRSNLTLEGACRLLFLSLFFWSLVSQSTLGDATKSDQMLSGSEVSSITRVWKFQKGDNLKWAEPDFDDSSWSTTLVPRVWPNGGFPDEGQFGWYRLKLKFTPGAHQGLGLRFAAVRNAYEIFAGGKLLGGVGELPPIASINYDKIKVYAIPLDAIDLDDTLHLAVRVWGGSDLAVKKSGGGIYIGEILIGPHTQLIRSLDNEQLPRVILAALFLVAGIFFLYLYKRASELQSFLWFGLTAVVLAPYIVTQTQWKYSLDLPFIVFEKIESGTLYLFAALFLQTQWSIVDKTITPPVRIFQFYFLFAAIILVLVPGIDIHYYSRGILQFSLILGIVLMYWVVIAQAWAGQKDAQRLLAGVIICGACSVNDLLLNMQIIQSVSLVSFGFLAILLSMVISLANKFTTLMTSLEQQVTDRTHELNQARMKFEELAHQDPLTSLLNRRGFINDAEVEIQRFIRSGRSFSLVLSDIDFFKRFNDEHGHACGDAVLQDVASLLQDHLRDVDRVARWGGEEFILLLPETSADGAQRITEKLREKINNTQFQFENQKFSVAMTFGVATYRSDESLTECIARADAALYEGKAEGRNKVVVSTTS